MTNNSAPSYIRTGLTPISGVLDLPLPKDLPSCARGISDASSIKAGSDEGLPSFCLPSLVYMENPY